MSEQPAPQQPSAGRPSHFIPFHKADIIRMCLGEGKLAPQDHQSFQEFAKILSALFHYEYHDRLETLKETYAPLNPDEATRRVSAPTRQERDAAEKQFLAMLGEVLTGANFTELSRQEIQESVSASPELGIFMEVDLDDFDQVRVFRRERHAERVTRKKLFGLVKKEVDQPVYDRVVLYLRFKDEVGAQGAIGSGQPGQAYLKLFSRVPADGLEMLFPNAKMKMRLIDKLLIGVPAAVTGLIMLATKLAPTLLLVGALVMVWVGLRSQPVAIEQKHLVALGLALFALAAFLWKQFSKVKTKRMKYLRTLSENLYFYVFDNNAGVLHHLIGAAEDEDFKEALLGYYFLLTRARPMTEEELDREIEAWFAGAHGATLDFEVDDAVRKLERMGLAKRDAGGRLTVMTLAESKQRIDWLWDNFFSYNEG